MEENRIGVGGSLRSIFWLSVLGLYIELLLIRWIGTEVRIFAYLQNTVLVVCFLGLGAGLFSSRRPVNLTRLLAAIAALTVVLVVPQTRLIFGNISQALSLVADVNIWDPIFLKDKSALPIIVGVALVLTLVLLSALLEVFVPLGTEDFATHHVPLESAPDAYKMFQEKRDGAVKVLFKPGTATP